MAGETSQYMVSIEGRIFWIPNGYVLVKKPELLKVGLPSRHTEGEGTEHSAGSPTEGEGKDE